MCLVISLPRGTNPSYVLSLEHLSISLEHLRHATVSQGQLDGTLYVIRISKLLKNSLAILKTSPKLVQQAPFIHDSRGGFPHLPLRMVGGGGEGSLDLYPTLHY